MCVCIWFLFFAAACVPRFATLVSTCVESAKCAQREGKKHPFNLLLDFNYMRTCIPLISTNETRARVSRPPRSKLSSVTTTFWKKDINKNGDTLISFGHRWSDLGSLQPAAAAPERFTSHFAADTLTVTWWHMSVRGWQTPFFQLFVPFPEIIWQHFNMRLIHCHRTLPIFLGY